MESKTSDEALELLCNDYLVMEGKADEQARGKPQILKRFGFEMPKKGKGSCWQELQLRNIPEVLQ